jgi:benzoate/toluate 1,2-dioxygenase reductase subunit
VRFFSAGGDPADERRVRFWVRAFPDGAVTRYLRGSPSPAHLWKLAGPQGLFVLRESSRPKVLVGGGTGLAPLIAMLHGLTRIDPQTPCWLFFGAPHPDGLFALDELSGLQRRLPQLTVVLAADRGARGDIHDGNVVSALRHARQSGALDEAAEGYICGPPGMVDAARDELRELLPDEEITNERFSQ